ncbi:hypothetical protein BU15DRAFT_68300 [Melanogaster broomeanus]|nr:hypothetical protein BU15DRAFT_68300 [Melanogaster broomeanus]
MPHDGHGRRRTLSPDRSSRGQKRPRSGDSDHDRRRRRGWVFEPQSGSSPTLVTVRTARRTVTTTWTLRSQQTPQCAMPPPSTNCTGRSWSTVAMPTKIIQRHTAEWSEDEPNTDDVESGWPPATAMQLVGDSVILTVDKREFAFSGEAAKKATVAYQKGHMPPVSLGVRHWGDMASPLTVPDVDRLFANVRDGRGKAASQVQRYGQMLATASELGRNLSDAQAYGLAHWRGLSGHNPTTGPSMRPVQVSGASNLPMTSRGTQGSATHLNDPPSAWTEWLKVYDRHRTGVLVYEDGTRSMRAMRGSMLMSRMQPSVGSSSSQQHFIQQAALLLMLPGQYRAITERFDISISVMRAVGPIWNFGPNSGVIDVARAMAYQGITWSEVDDVCLYGRTLAHHLLTGNTPLPEVIRQGLQEYEIRIHSAELATWYSEVLPSGMAPALSRVGPALVEAFAVPRGMVVPPGEANRTHAAHIPGPQDQDQDMDGPPASSEPGTVEPSLGNTTVTVVPLGVVLMEVEPGELPSASELELAQEGEGVKGT